MFAPEYFHTVVPLGILTPAGSFKAAGAGVLLVRHDVSWLVTARHVSLAGRDGDPAVTKEFVAIGTAESGDQFPIPINQILEQHAIGWVESDSETDLAAAPIPLSPDWVLRTIPEELTIAADQLTPGMISYTVGVPYGLATLNPEQVAPLILDGVVAGTDRQRDAVYTSAPTFPGNSGGPLFVHRSPFNIAGGLTVGQPPVLFAGIVLQQMLVAPPSPVAGSTAPSLHLGMARGVASVLRLLDSDEARGTADVVQRSPGGPSAG